MMRFAPDFLDEIRARLPISSVVGARVAFDHKKSNASRGDFWACCPFHSEKTPSFHCDDKRGRYHCFGCGASGDHFRFLTESEGLSFVEAVEQLAMQAGLAMPKRDEQADGQLRERKNLNDVLELAAKFFTQMLSEAGGARARDYLRLRGVSPELINHFRLGFAPDSRTALKDYLTTQGVGLDYMERAGLVVSGENIAQAYDRFRNRIIFPISDIKGRLVAFGGRAMDTQARAKYLNSPETELFHKGEMLYNLAVARKAVLEQFPKNVKRFSDKNCDDNKGPEQEQANREGEAVAARTLLVVEGYMDVLALSRAGFKAAVAPLGTALTPAQLQLLWRFSPVPVLCFDGDEAGFNAAFRVLDRALPLLKAGQSLQFMLLPDGKDPDDIVREGGAQAFAALLAQAKPLADMLFLRETQGRSLDTPEARALLESNLRKAAFTIEDETLRHYYLQDLRARARALFRPWSQNAKGGHVPYMAGKRRARQGEPGGISLLSSLASSRMVQNDSVLIPLREAAILAMGINHPILVHEEFEQFAQLEFANAQMRALHQAMLDILVQWQPDDGQAMRQLLCVQGQQKNLSEIDRLLRRAGMRSAFMEAPFDDAKEALKQALHLHFHAHNLHKRLHEIERELLGNPDADMFVLLQDVRSELERTNATEALIDGFGDWQSDTKSLILTK